MIFDQRRLHIDYYCKLKLDSESLEKVKEEGVVLLINIKVTIVLQCLCDSIK